MSLILFLLFSNSCRCDVFFGCSQLTITSIPQLSCLLTSGPTKTSKKQSVLQKTVSLLLITALSSSYHSWSYELLLLKFTFQSSPDVSEGQFSWAVACGIISSSIIPSLNNSADWWMVGWGTIHLFCQLNNYHNKSCGCRQYSRSFYLSR